MNTKNNSMDASNKSLNTFDRLLNTNNRVYRSDYCMKKKMTVMSNKRNLSVKKYFKRDLQFDKCSDPVNEDCDSIKGEIKKNIVVSETQSNSSYSIHNGRNEDVQNYNDGFIHINENRTSSPIGNSKNYIWKSDLVVDPIVEYPNHNRVNQPTKHQTALRRQSPQSEYEDELKYKEQTVKQPYISFTMNKEPSRLKKGIMVNRMLNIDFDPKKREEANKKAELHFFKKTSEGKSRKREIQEKKIKNLQIELEKSTKQVEQNFETDNLNKEYQQHHKNRYSITLSSLSKIFKPKPPSDWLVSTNYRPMDRIMTPGTHVSFL